MEIWGRNQTAFDALYVLSLHPKMLAARDAVQGCLLALDTALPVSESITVPDWITGGRVLREDETGEVVRQWNGLSGEHQARCHIPRHGLATVRDGTVDWFASICFECANVYIAGPNASEEHRIIQFEGNPFEARLNLVLAQK